MIPHSHPDPPLAQREAVTYCCYLGAEADPPPLAPASSQELLEAVRSPLSSSAPDVPAMCRPTAALVHTGHRCNLVNGSGGLICTSPVMLNWEETSGAGLGHHLRGLTHISCRIKAVQCRSEHTKAGYHQSLNLPST